MCSNTKSHTNTPIPLVHSQPQRSSFTRVMSRSTSPSSSRAPLLEESKPDWSISPNSHPQNRSFSRILWILTCLVCLQVANSIFLLLGMSGKNLLPRNSSSRVVTISEDEIISHGGAVIESSLDTMQSGKWELGMVETGGDINGLYRPCKSHFEKFQRRAGALSIQNWLIRFVASHVYKISPSKPETYFPEVSSESDRIKVRKNWDSLLPSKPAVMFTWAYVESLGRVNFATKFWSVCWRPSGLSADWDIRRQWLCQNPRARPIPPARKADREWPSTWPGCVFRFLGACPALCMWSCHSHVPTARPRLGQAWGSPGSEILEQLG